MRAFHLLIAAAILAAPVSATAQLRDNDHRHRPQAPREAAVDFGILPLAPLGSPDSGCAQTGVGGPADPCAYKLHVLLPDETTVREKGEVIFQIHGGGHAMAIYEVSRNTSRNDIGRFLCPGPDPATIPFPSQQPCNGPTPAGAANANAEHIVLDGRGKVVLIAQANAFPQLPPPQVPHPHNRVWSPDDRLMSAGGRQFLAGGTIPAGPTSDGQLVTYRFLEEGRYLVICMNRSHFLNDWMFGFVNVVDR